MEIHSGKTLRPANLSNEYNRMFFFNFPFSGKQASRGLFSSEKNKMDNSQNGYSSVEKTGNIKKMFQVSVCKTQYNNYFQ